MIGINASYDIHQKDSMAEDYSELALRLKAIIDTAIDGIITIDQFGHVESINNSAAKMFNYKPEEVVGKNISMLMPEPHQSSHDGYIQRYLDTKKPRIIGIGREVPGKKKSGKIFPFRLAVSEVILNDRIIFTGVIHDLTQVKKAEEELLQAKASLEEKVEERTNELEQVVNQLLETNTRLAKSQAILQLSLEKEKELNELKSRFVSMASHEFRTPLSTIMSSASLLSKYNDPIHTDRKAKHVGRIKSAVNNLTGILNDFLSLSKLEEGKVELNPEVVVIKDLLNMVKDEVEGIQKEDQVIHIKVSGKAQRFISDPRILKNIFFNLISNAIKYSPGGSMIICEVNYKKEFINFKVKDEGIGIPEKEQKFLFERFFRASNVENVQGTGLGLNIVKQYLEILSGSIEMASKPGKGSTFSINLPYQI